MDTVWTGTNAPEPGFTDNVTSTTRTSPTAQARGQNAIEMGRSDFSNRSSRLWQAGRRLRSFSPPFDRCLERRRGGLLQLLGMSLSSCHRYHPAEVEQPSHSAFGCPCCLRPPVVGSAFGPSHFRGHLCVHFRYGPMTRNLPPGRLCR